VSAIVFPCIVVVKTLSIEVSEYQGAL
jgi:general stress protein CsbA